MSALSSLGLIHEDLVLHIGARVAYLETVGLQHDRHDVLADGVRVSLHGADDAGSLLYRLQHGNMGLQDLDAGHHGLGRHQQLRHEELMAVELLAHDFHACRQPLVDGLESVKLFRHHLLGQLLHLLAIPLHDGVGKVLENLVSVQHESITFPCRVCPIFRRLRPIRFIAHSFPPATCRMSSHRIDGRRQEPRIDDALGHHRILHSAELSLQFHRFLQPVNIRLAIGMQAR